MQKSAQVPSSGLTWHILSFLRLLSVLLCHRECGRCHPNTETSGADVIYLSESGPLSVSTMLARDGNGPSQSRGGSSLLSCLYARQYNKVSKRKRKGELGALIWERPQ